MLTIRRLLALVTLACAGIGAAPAPVPRIVAVGDLHGDFAAWRAIAQAAGLEDQAGRWAGGRTVFVQTGDVIDRGPDGKRLMEELIRLQREAARAGGRLVALVGNHEAMNVTDDLRYVSAADFAAYADGQSEQRRHDFWRDHRGAIIAAYRTRDPSQGDDAVEQAWRKDTPPGKLEHEAAWHASGAIGRWVVDNPAVAVIDGTLFVHGGIGAAYADHPVADINRAVAAALRGHDTSEAAIINDEKGPLWYRGLVAGTPAAAAELDTALAGQHVARMVVAHTPILTGIAILYGGKLVRIDTGISAVFGGTPSYLEIIDGKPVPHAVPRPAG